MDLKKFTLEELRAEISRREEEAERKKQREIKPSVRCVKVGSPSDWYWKRV